MIPHNRPHITQEDRAAVDRVLGTGWVAQGVEVGVLESGFTNLYRGGAACAVASGTAALFLALKALGAGAGLKVAIPTYACSALLNAVYHANAIPVLTDVTPSTFCMDPDHPAMKDANIVIAVNMYGAYADLRAIRRPGQKIIEDCCHSLGSVGRAQDEEGDAAVFSFYATKLITGGQGGLVWARNQEVIEAVRDYRQFDCRESYVPRFNLQMTDLQAALINSQMLRLQEIRQRRQDIAETYLSVLADGLTTQARVIGSDYMTYRFVVCAPDMATRDALKQHLADAGVGSAVPIERYELLHRYLNLRPQGFPVAERLTDVTLSLPMHAGLTDAEIDHVVQTLGGFRP